MISIDLNCDIGEGFGSYKFGNDEAIMKYVTSVNIACGFHAGDPLIMAKTVMLALENNLAIGAHPGYPDLIGFGRRYMSVNMEEARAFMIYQLGALDAFAKTYGGSLQHVKPHGALYNAAAKDYKLARALAEAVYDFDSSLIFLGLSGSVMIKAAQEVGLRTASEVFADRAYEDDGSLVARGKDNSLIEGVDSCVDRVLRMITEGKVRSVNGFDVDIAADSICLHGDNLMALDFAEAIFNKINENGIALSKLSNICLE